MQGDKRQAYPDSYYSPLTLLWNHLIDFGFWLILGLSVLGYVLECFLTTHKWFVSALSTTSLQHVLSMNMNLQMLNAMPSAHGLMLVPAGLLSIFMVIVRLLAFSFLSVSLGHLIGNMFVLGLFFLMAYWLRIKQYLLFKSWFYVSLGTMAGYFVIGHLINLVTKNHITWLSIQMHDATPLLGASVGVLGVVGFVMVLSIISMIETFQDARDREMSLSLTDWLCLLPVVIGIATVFNLVTGQSCINAVVLHWLGLIVGIVSATVWYSRYGQDDEAGYTDD